MNRIQLKNITHFLKKEKIVDTFSIDFSEKNFIGLLGEDDTAISTLLKMIAGIEQPDEGIILINRINMFDTSSEMLKILQKDISFVFRSGALLSNLTLRENLLLPMDYHMQELDQTQKNNIITDWMNKFEVPFSHLNSRPADVSPIMRKTFLIIRAFITEPKLILYDEPFIYLDVRRRNILFNQIMQFKEDGDVCQIFISDFFPALYKYSDLILILEKGKLVDSGNWGQLVNSDNKNTKSIFKEFTKAENYETNL